MRNVLASLGMALVLLAPIGAAAQDDSGDTETGSRIEHKGPKPPEPLSRKKFDHAVEKMFRAADTDGKGLITLAEFNAEITARKDKAIRERFDRIDTDHNQSISLAEFAQWQGSMGSVVLAQEEGTAPGTDIVAEQLPLDLPYDQDGDTMRQLIEPIGATMLVAANTDYDEGVSLAELLAYEGQKFDAADLNKDGWLTFDEVEKLAPHGRGGPRGPGGPGGPGGRRGN